MDTIAAIATAIGGAIGIIRISGNNAIDVVNKIFKPANKKAFKEMKPREMIYGNLYDRFENIIDSCMAVYFKGNRTYTGEDMAELHVHGSPAVLSETLSALFKNGARQAEAGEFTKRAFLNGKLSLMQAEAVSDLIYAQTIEAANNAACQISGKNSQYINELRQNLIGLCSHFLAVIDYPDEDIDPFLQDEMQKILYETQNKLYEFEKSYERGRILREGLPCAIVGKPNVGKSTLLNALAGFERAIVTDIEGTTRDTVEEVIKIGALMLRLQDTAGIRESGDIVEKIGIERARKAVDLASIILFVVDGSCDLNEQDYNIFKTLNKPENVIVVVNKSDKGICLRNIPDDFKNIVYISAKSYDGIENLKNKILDLTGINNFVFDGNVITNARQANAIEKAEKACKRALDAARSNFTADAILQDVESAIFSLGEITGQSVRDDIISDIFSRFCVGK